MISDIRIKNSDGSVYSYLTLNKDILWNSEALFDLYNTIFTNTQFDIVDEVMKTVLIERCVKYYDVLIHYPTDMMIKYFKSRFLKPQDIHKFYKFNYFIKLTESISSFAEMEVGKKIIEHILTTIKYDDPYSVILLGKLFSTICRYRLLDTNTMSPLIFKYNMCKRICESDDIDEFKDEFSENETCMLHFVSKYKCRQIARYLEKAITKETEINLPKHQIIHKILVRNDNIKFKIDSRNDPDAYNYTDG